MITEHHHAAAIAGRALVIDELGAWLITDRATALRIAAQKTASPSGSGTSSAGSLTLCGSATGMTREPRVSTIRAVPSRPALSLSNTAYRRGRCCDATRARLK